MSEVVGDLVVKIGADIAGFKETMLVAGEAVAAIYAVKQIAEYGIEAAKASLVQENFNYMVGKKGTEALDGMTAATLGTISKVELMKDANAALIRGIDAEYLPSLSKLSLQLQQAGNDGASLSEVINAISRVIETGRTQALVPLGIDVSKLKDELKGVNDAGDRTALVMQAVADTSSKMLDPTDNAATAAQQLHAQWTNFKDDFFTVIGPAIVSTIHVIEDAGAGLKSQFSNSVVGQYMGDQGWEGGASGFTSTAAVIAAKEIKESEQTTYSIEYLRLQASDQKLRNDAEALLNAAGVKDINDDLITQEAALLKIDQQRLSTANDYYAALQKSLGLNNNQFYQLQHTSYDQPSPVQAVTSDGGKTWHAPGATVVVNTYNDTTAKLQYKGA